MYEGILGKYLASHFDMSLHSTNLKIDLTDAQDILPLENQVDILICPMFLSISLITTRVEQSI